MFHVDFNTRRTVPSITNTILLKTLDLPSVQPTEKQLIWHCGFDSERTSSLNICHHLLTLVLFSFFFCGKSSTECGSWFLTFIKRWFIAQKTKKSHKSIRKVHRKCAQMSKWWQSCHFGVRYNFMSLLTFAVYLFCHYIFLSNISTSTWCAEIHIFVMLPFHIYRNKMNIWNDKHQHEAFTKIFLRSVWSQIWWRTDPSQYL